MKISSFIISILVLMHLTYAAEAEETIISSVEIGDSSNKEFFTRCQTEARLIEGDKLAIINTTTKSVKLTVHYGAGEFYSLQGSGTIEFTLEAGQIGLISDSRFHAFNLKSLLSIFIDKTEIFHRSVGHVHTLEPTIRFLISSHHTNPASTEES